MTKYATRRIVKRELSDFRQISTHCDACLRPGTPGVDLKRIWQSTTLGRSLPFWVCKDAAPCAALAMERQAKRAVEQGSAKISDLYPE